WPAPTRIPAPGRWKRRWRTWRTARPMRTRCWSSSIPTEAAFPPAPGDGWR
ncbi:MAG: hypothetical protein AVDCRST_MAG89-1191, partial [uncultured Gemmatimonadetes bacterium]